MKTKLAVAVALVCACAWGAEPQAAINATCPVKTGTAVKNITSNYQGKTIAFC